MRNQAGKLDRRITVQRNSSLGQVDDVGGEVVQWENVAEVWASVRLSIGTETFQTQQRTQKQTATFTIRYLAGVDPKMRIAFDGRLYDIVDVREVGRRELLEIDAFAREVVSA